MHITIRSPSLLLTSVVAGVYSLVVCGLLVVDAAQRFAETPFDSPEFLVLKQAFLKDPAHEPLQKEIRALDFALREEYFREQQFTRTGVCLLLAGVIVMLVTGKWSATLERKLPHPAVKELGPDSDERLSRHGLWAVAVTVVALTGTIWAMNTSHPWYLPENLDASGGGTAPPGTVADAGTVVTQPAAVPLPSREEYRRSWPRFRGPQGSGISMHKDIPRKWNGQSGEGILWKTPVPLPGVSSPIVWQDRVFLTGATPEKRAVYCFDAAKGTLLWQKELSHKSGAKGPPPKVNKDTGYAAPTMATDGRFAYAMFATGDVAAFDFSGNELWQVALGPLKNTYGHAASLDVHREWVIVQVDHGKTEEGLSRLLALDGATGRVIWQVERNMPSSWSSPVVVDHEGQDQVLTCGDPWVTAYVAATGAELWRANCFASTEIGPSPVYSAGLVFVANEYATLAAIRAGGSGDVTDSHIAWQAEDGLPDACSPLVTDKFLLLLTAAGTLTCYDKAAGGDPLWEEDFENDCSSSPSLAGEHVYLFARNGQGWIVQPTAEKCQRVAEVDLGEECVTSPAFQDGRIYIRGANNLFCIGGK